MIIHEDSLNELYDIQSALALVAELASISKSNQESINLDNLASTLSYSASRLKYNLDKVSESHINEPKIRSLG